MDDGSATLGDGMCKDDMGMHNTEVRGQLQGATGVATAPACIVAPWCSTTMYSSTSIMASRSVSVPRQCRSSASEYVSACTGGHDWPSGRRATCNKFITCRSL